MVRNQNVFKSRRAVGGLISLIALIIVFGIASLAFLEINLTHADFVLNSIHVNEKQFNRINEQLNFTITNSTGADTYTVIISNIWNDKSTLESHINLNSENEVTKKRYLNATTVPSKQNIIGLEEDSTLNFVNDLNSTHNDETIIFVTNNGNKCIIPVPTEGDSINRLC